MTNRGGGLYLSATEKDPVKVNTAIRQVIEGRSNAVGTFTVTADGSSTTTTVTASTCGANSVVVAFPATSASSVFLRGSSIYIRPADITAGQFVVTHAATSTASLDFMWICLG